MRQITKLLMALPVIAGLGLASVPAAQAQPGPHMMGGPGWGGGPRGGPGGPRGGYYHHRGPGGGAIAGALIGGLAVGALAGATMAGGPPVAYAPPPPPPPPAYVVPAVPVMPGPGYGYYGPRGYYQTW